MIYKHIITTSKIEETSPNKKFKLKVKTTEQQNIERCDHDDSHSKINSETSERKIKIQTYKCVKLPLTKILQNQPDESDKKMMIPLKESSIQIRVIDNATILQKINETAIRTNKIIIKTYLLLRAWILYKYQQHPDTLMIDRNIIKIAIQVICSPKDATRKTKEKSHQVASDQQKKQFKDQCYQELQHLNPYPPENSEHLSHILDHQITIMLTSIENNVKCHFSHYLKRYINTVLTIQYPESLTDTNSKKQFQRDLYKVNDDLLNNRSPSQYQSDHKFHEWMIQQKTRILPLLDSSETYYVDVYDHPSHYLKHMIQMNQEIGRLGCAMFQFFPLRSELVPKHIQIDTSVLIDLFVDHGNGQLLANIQDCQDALWSIFFCIKPHVKNYQFDHAIITDGVSVTYRLIDHLEKIKKQQHYENMKKGRETAREYREQGIEKPPKKERPKKKPPQSKVPKPPEFSYIDEVPREYLEGDHAFIDGGKKNLLAAINDDDETLNYTNQQRLHETKSLKHQRLLYNYRFKKGILLIEQELSGYNSKTCDYEQFRQYMLKKIEVNEKLYPLYEDPIFRQYQWYSYLNRQRSESHMIDQVSVLFDKSGLPRKKQTISRKNKHLRKSKCTKRSTKKKNRRAMKLQKKDALIIQRVQALKEKLMGKSTGKVLIQLKKTDDIRSLESEINHLDDQIKIKNQIISQLDTEIVSSLKKLWVLKQDIYHLKNENCRSHRCYSQKHQASKNNRCHNKQQEMRESHRLGSLFGTIDSPVIIPPRQIVIMGDWSIGKQMRNFIPTPNLRLKRLLADAFYLYDIDEFRTSCVHHKTETRCDNLYLPDHLGRIRKLHSVLTYQMNQGLGCINRDSNGRQNIRKLFEYYLEHGDRPEKYRRGFQW